MNLTLAQQRALLDAAEQRLSVSAQSNDDQLTRAADKLRASIEYEVERQERRLRRKKERMANVT